MKLNMIVVMTTWLPRRAWSHAGTKAHAAPKAAATATAATTTSGAGQPPAPRQTQRHAEAPEVGLPLRADVEEPAVEAPRPRRGR